MRTRRSSEAARVLSLLQDRRDRCPRASSIEALVSDVMNEANVWNPSFQDSPEQLELLGLALPLRRSLDRFLEITEAEASRVRRRAVLIAQRFGLAECPECERFFGGKPYEGFCSSTCAEDQNDRVMERRASRG